MRLQRPVGDRAVPGQADVARMGLEAVLVSVPRRCALHHRTAFRPQPLPVLSASFLSCCCFLFQIGSSHLPQCAHEKLGSQVPANKGPLSLNSPRSESSAVEQRIDRFHSRRYQSDNQLCPPRFSQTKLAQIYSSNFNCLL